MDSNAMKMSMGEKLKMFRELNQLTQDALGEKLNVSDKTISAWENGEREITLPNATSICAFFEIPESYFVFDEGENRLPLNLKEKIKEYIKTKVLLSNISKIIENCKKKIEQDGLVLKKEFLPSFDAKSKTFITYGIFDCSQLPARTKTTQRYSGVGNGISVALEMDEDSIDNPKRYQYDAEKLAKYGLYDVLNRFNKDTVLLSDLTCCNDLEIIINTIEREKKAPLLCASKGPYGYRSYPSQKRKPGLQEQLNGLLEHLDPNLPNFWRIIVYLIDQGAYYEKQSGEGDELTTFKNVKDTSKTNIVYRIAKDKCKD